MKLSDILKENQIISNLKARDKKRVLEELVDVIACNRPAIDKESLVKVLLDREHLGSTGIGDGVAIPHGKFQDINEPIISFGRSLDGLDFDSIDGQPVFLFFLLIAPENSAGVHLKALARIAKILKNSSFRNLLIEAETREELFKTIIQNDEEF
jgi:PTS system nitrogen regulatory IIA component